MNRVIIIIWTVLAFGAVLAGGADNKIPIQKTFAGSRQDVFQVIQTSQPVTGKALLQIEFPVKTYKGRFLNTYFKYEHPPYTVLVTIDGQSVELTDNPVLEKLSGDIKDNPESGTGWKYNFKKTLLLEPGKHQVVILVPLSNVHTEKELAMVAGANVLKIQPVYNSSVSRHTGYTGFNHGLSGLVLQLNNQIL